MTEHPKSIVPGERIWFYSPGFNHCYGSAVVEEVKSAERTVFAPVPNGVHPGALMANAYYEPIGDLMREILAQYNEQFSSSNDWRFWGPHYVRFDRGRFLLYPFGRWSDDRYRFEVRPDYQSPKDERWWIFEVMA